ncbi:hypothetical protein [Clostridium butyricum]
MKNKILTVLSTLLIGYSLCAFPASANTWFEYKDYNGNRITWGMYDDNGQWPQGWYQENGKWYYFPGQGLAAQGLQTIDGKDYYFDPINCDMKHDEYVKVGSGRQGMWYWASSSGAIDYNYSWCPEY